MRAWTGSGQTLGALGSIGALGPGRGRRDDGGTEGAGTGVGRGGDVFSRSALVGDRGRREGEVNVFSRSGRCVQFWGQCVQFLAECVHFRGECVHFGGRCVQFLAGRPGWGWGADGRRDSSAPLRCARNDRSGGGEPGPGMAGAGNDVNAGNAISACVAGSAGKAGLSGVLRHLCKVRVESRVLA